jgi:formyl-CoA transferase
MTGTRPLSGIRVLDLTQIYNGPYATFLMAMAGADVIKVEPPGGEYLRRRDARAGADVPFAMLNSGKRSVSLNLKSQKGLALFMDLVRGADVVAENYAPGVMSRLGIGFDALRAVNPRIILASGSGYGQDGLYRDLPAMDLTVQAMSGVMSVTGFAENPPVKSGAALCDFFGGVHMFGALAMALFRRERTGEGAHIDISMLEAVYPALASSIGMLYGDRDDIPLRTGNRHGGLSLCPYNVYPAADGHIAIICNAERHWGFLCDAIGRPDLGADEGLSTMAKRVARMDDVDAIIADWTRARTKHAAIATLNAHRVPCSPVRELPEVLRDEALHGRGFLRDVPHPKYGTLTVNASPLRIKDTDPGDPVPVSDYGADNRAVYGETGLSDSDLKALAAEGVI